MGRAWCVVFTTVGLLALSLGPLVWSEVKLARLFTKDPYQVISNAPTYTKVSDVWISRLENYPVAHVTGQLTPFPKLQSQMESRVNEYVKYNDEARGDACFDNETTVVPEDGALMIRTNYYKNSDGWWGSSCKDTLNGTYLDNRILSSFAGIAGFSVDMTERLHHEFAPHLEPFQVTQKNVTNKGCRGYPVQDYTIDRMDSCTKQTKPLNVTGVYVPGGKDIIMGYQILRSLTVTIVASLEPQYQYPRLSWGYRIPPVGRGVYLMRPGKHSPTDMAEEFLRIVKEQNRGGDNADYDYQKDYDSYVPTALAIRVVSMLVNVLTLTYLQPDRYSNYCCCKCCGASCSSRWMKGLLWSFASIAAVQWLYLPLCKNYFLWASVVIVGWLLTGPRIWKKLRPNNDDTETVGGNSKYEQVELTEVCSDEDEDAPLPAMA